MSNGLRHFLGLLVGLLLTPVFAAGLAWGPQWTGEAGVDYDLTAVPGVPSWLAPLAVLAVLGLLLGLVMGSRLSPLAALVPGLLIGASGLVEAAALPQPVPGLSGLLQVDGPDSQPWFEWGPLFVAVGASLFFSALPPSRWRGAVRDSGDYEDSYRDYEPAEDPARWHSAPPAGSHSQTPPEGTPRPQSWDADGMPPRYHVPDSTAQQPQASDWNQPRGQGYRGSGEGTGYSGPPRWEDRNHGY